MRCEEIEPLLAARLVGSLGEVEQRRVEEHLVGCEECFAIAGDLEASGAEIGEALIAAIDDFDELGVVEPENYVRGAEIGRGGMGRIVHARDRRLGRVVALKELLDDRLRRRFEQEARLTARLMHPAIVNVLEAGRWPSGAPFYAMKFVDGRPLDRVIAEAKTLAARLALLPNFITMVEAIAYAHDQGVIHRDLKPHNVLVGPFGETVVIDWGLAKDLRGGEEGAGPGPYRDEGPSFTVAGAGTPSYMPLEQADGKSDDARVDVYALGATLYHLLGGCEPYAGLSATHVLAALRKGPPLPLVDVEPGVPRALVAIVEKAMARDAAQRYASAGELAKELSRFQSGQLVAAHSYTWRERAERFVRRHRAPLAIAALATVGLGAVGAVSLDRVLDARRRAEAQLGELLVERGQQELMRGAPTRALVYLAEARGLGVDTPALQALIDEAARPMESLERSFSLGASPPTSARLSADASRLAVATADGATSLWNVAHGKRIAALDLRATAETRFAFSADGARLAGVTPCGAFRWVDQCISVVRVWDATTGELKLALPHLERVGEIDADGEVLEVWGKGTHWRWSFASGQLVSFANGLRDGAGDADLARASTDGSTLLAAGREGGLHVLDAHSKLERGFFDLPSGTLVEAGLDGHGGRLTAVASDGTVRVWRARGRLVAADEAGSRVVAIDFAGERTLAATDTSAAVFEGDGALAARQELGTYWRRALAAGFSRDGREVVVGGNGWIARWTAGGAGAPPLRSVPGDVAGAPSGGLLLERDGRILNGDGTVVAAVGGQHLSLDASGSRVVGLRGIGSGRVAAVWEAASGRLLRSFPVGTPASRLRETVRAAGDTVAVMEGDRELALWDLASGGRLATLHEDAGLEMVTLSPDGGRVFTSAGGLSGTIWSARGELLAEVALKSPTAAAFSGDGARLLVGERDGRARVVDAATGMLISVIGPLPEPVSEVRFAPSGDRAVVIAGPHLTIWRAGVERRDGVTIASLRRGVPLELHAGRLVSPRREIEEVGPEEQARRLFELGVEALGEGNEAEARSSILAALRVDPRPASLGRALVVHMEGSTQAMRARFEVGQDFYDQRNYEQAMVEFWGAYAIKPAASLLFNIAVCEEKLRRYAEAAKLFRRYLSESPNARDRASVTARIEALERR